MQKCRNANCTMHKAKCKRKEQECQMPDAKCQMPNAKYKKCQLPTAQLGAFSLAKVKVKSKMPQFENSKMPKIPKFQTYDVVVHVAPTTVDASIDARRPERCDGVAKQHNNPDQAKRQIVCALRDGQNEALALALALA